MNQQPPIPDCTCAKDKEGLGIFSTSLSEHAMNCPCFKGNVQKMHNSSVKPQPPIPEEKPTVCIHPRLKNEPDYMGWHEWAEKKSKTHKQVKCVKCGRYAIWIKR